jgi:peptidoglycan/LPS O-acetylase OafA/YrhL
VTIARFESIVLWLAGLFFLAPGIWAFVAPHSFYDQLAPFPPYNRHLLHDIGAFQIGIGAALLLALRWTDARFVVLAGASAAAIVHLISHIVDHDLGGKDTDVVVFGAFAVLLVLATAMRWNGMRGASRQPATAQPPG